MELHELSLGSSRIALRQSSGAGDSIVLIHGNSCSSSVFSRQFDSFLGSKYRLIAFDLPGHGHSPKPTDKTAAYSLRGYARTVVDAVTQLGLRDAFFVGWSLGGHILLEAADQLPEARGLVIFGTPPLVRPFTPERCFLPHPGGSHLFSEHLSDEQVRSLAEAFFRSGGADVPESFLEDIRRTDPAARSQLLPTLLRADYEDEVEIIRRARAPVAILHGQHDQVVDYRYLIALGLDKLWRGAPQLIPDAGHAAHWENAKAFNALIDEFIQSQQRLPRVGMDVGVVLG